LRLDMATSAKMNALAQVLTGEDTSEQHLLAATEVAQAQLKLLRIREARAEIMTAVDLTRGDLQELRRLVALDRYERYARTKRRRAAHKL
jgi:hypothetical protein